MRVKASPPRAPAYPRIADAWRVLLGAAPLVVGGVAHADSSVPPCPTQHKPDQPQPMKQPPMPTPPLPGGMMRPRTPEPPTPQPPKSPDTPKKLKQQPAPPKRDELFQIDGGYGRRVAPPDAPRFVMTDDPEGAIVIHAHGPDEPCKRRT